MGAVPLMIAFRAGAPDAVKESLLEAWPEVASADGVLAAALKEKWGDAYVARMVASAPEVTHVNVPEGQGEDERADMVVGPLSLDGSGPLVWASGKGQCC